MIRPFGRFINAYLNRRSRIPESISRLVDAVLELSSLGAFRVAPLRDMALEASVEFVLLRPVADVHWYPPISVTGAGASPTSAPVLRGAGTSGYRRIRDATVCGRSTSALTESRILVPSETRRLRDEARVEGHGIILRGRDACVRRDVPPDTSVPTAIFLGGRGADNWYHFLVEIAPRILLRDELPSDLRDIPLIVAEETLAAASSRQLIELLAPGAEVIPIPTGGAVHVASLIWIDVPVHSPYKLDRWVEIRPDHEAIDVGFYREFREHVLTAARVGSSTGAGSPLFLDRGPNDSRPYNRDEVLAVALKYGFVPVDLGSLDLKNQLQRMWDAAAVLGPHGAAWTNVLFASEGVRGLTLTPLDRRVTGFSGFQNLAEAAGVELRDLVMQRPDHGNRVDLSQLEEAVVRMLDAACSW